MKGVRNANELYYRKTVTAIGVTLLIFLLLLNTVGIALAFLQIFLFSGLFSPIAAEVIYQLVYGGMYLLSFMLPVLVLKGMIKGSGYLYQPMRTDIRLSPYLFPIIFGGMILIWTQSYVNAGLVSIFNYSEFTAEFLWGSGESLKGYQIVLNFIIMAVVPAFCEEFLFRGAILTNCLPFGRGNAILISALLFGLMHQNAEQILYAFAAGIFLGIVYERTGSIWNCVFLHLVNNFSSTVFPILAEKLGGKHPDLMYAVLEGLLCFVGIICIAVLVRVLTHKKPDLKNGMFGISLPASDSYAACPIPAKRAFRLFLNFPMVLFLVSSALQMLLLLLLSLFYGML